MTNRLIAVLIGGVVIGAVIAIITMRIGGKKLISRLNRVHRRTLVSGIIIAAVSGLLYSVVHEFGHYIFAVALGGEVRSITWTIFGTVEPHVSYHYLPPAARPWAMEQLAVGAQTAVDSSGTEPPPRA